MENVLLRKLRMFGSTRTVLTSNDLIWISSLPFKKKVEEFIAYLESIEDKDHDQKSSKSYTKEKNQVLEKMLDAALIVSSAGAAYAEVINNDKLKEDFNFIKSTLKFGNEKEVYKRCKTIGEDATTIAAELKEYNVTSEQILLLTDAVKDFFKLMDVPRDVRSASKTAKEEMIALFDDCDHILNDILDKMMLTYKNSHPDFYLEYTNVRHIGGWSKKKGDIGDEKNVA